MHAEIWDALENPAFRLLALKCFRGSAKTTLIRAFASKRIAYAISRTVLFVSAGQKHSIASLDWLKMEIEHNTLWAQTFGLEPSTPWTGEDIKIWHAIEKCHIRVIALGMTAQLRGFNFMGHRPDLILPDDPGGDENMGNLEQIEKNTDLFYAALVPSLAPESEVPSAKLVLAQTPIGPDDLIERACKSRVWHSLAFGCFDEAGESRWPARWSTEVLKEMKQSYADLNKMSVWMREYECVISSPETTRFRESWLRYYQTPPTEGRTYIAIDPATPDPGLSLNSRKMKARDFQALAVIRFWCGNHYLLDYDQAKGEAPDEFIAKVFTKVRQWNAQAIGVETIAYQKTLKWLLEKAMEKHRLFVPVFGLEDRRRKGDRITQTIGEAASSGHLFVHKDQVDFISNFVAYPNVKHDDLLDAVSMAIFGAGRYSNAEGPAKSLNQLARELVGTGNWRTCP